MHRVYPDGVYLRGWKNGKTRWSSQLIWGRDVRLVYANDKTTFCFRAPDSPARPATAASGAASVNGGMTTAAGIAGTPAAAVAAVLNGNGNPAMVNGNGVASMSSDEDMDIN